MEPDENIKVLKKSPKNATFDEGSQGDVTRQKQSLNNKNN